MEHDDQALDALLATPPGRVTAARRAEIESLLTAGYARALELEAERLRLAGDPDTAAGTSQAFAERLASLRDRLDEVNRRYGGSGKHDLDGGSGAGG